jgi:hypothetical protein
MAGLGLAWPSLLAAQGSIQIAPDEKDFEGFTSLALGSGARAFGMGGAFLARADDATAASWNPAGLSYLRKPEVALVGVRSSFGRGVKDQDITDRFVGYTADFAALAHPLSLGPFTGAVQLSYQRVFSFTGRRRIASEADPPNFTTEGRGGFDVLALGTGLKVSRTLRLGATLNRWLNGYHQDRIREAVISPRGSRGESRQQIDYSLRGWNVNVGVMWSPWETLNVGLVGKTPFTGGLTLERLRTDFATNLPDVGTANKSQSDAVRLDFPGAVGAGLSWRPRATLTLSADYTQTFWSHGRINNFFTLRGVGDVEGGGPGPVPYLRLPYPTLDDADQTDTQQIRLGAEHVIVGERVTVPLRMGVFTDRQYFRSGGRGGAPPRFAGLTAGVGVALGSVLLDAAYVHEWGSYLSPEAPVVPVKLTTRFQRIFVSVIFRPGTER